MDDHQSNSEGEFFQIHFQKCLFITRFWPWSSRKMARTHHLIPAIRSWKNPDVYQVVFSLHVSIYMILKVDVKTENPQYQCYSDRFWLLSLHILGSLSPFWHRTYQLERVAVKFSSGCFYPIHVNFKINKTQFRLKSETSRFSPTFLTTSHLKASCRVRSEGSLQFTQKKLQ